ncbi:MAG: bifunctional 2-polyprenyl-6-hydroxyphenol methylase/3-demethylubiquinol 3-O-methyltransferase UbiG [Pseudomonadota bacterium]
MTSTTSTGGAELVANHDLEELARFDAVAAGWWDPEGDFRPLHELNPVRCAFVTDHVAVDGLAVLDVGCGGGLLSEALNEQGAAVTGIDLSEGALKVARLHQHESGTTVDYQHSSVEALAESRAGEFDVITCMEMLEHVPDPVSVIRACTDLLAPGGWLFASTLNRTPQSFLLGIVAAEYVLGLLPRGTHQYRRFIKPSELTRCARQQGLGLVDLRGIEYNPLRRAARLTENPSVNYLAAYRKPLAAT